uniref:Uncharacterized protein n=1 Tax=Pelodiscus sinensis TaxID=13735 RepID=K7G8R6_PELSI
MSGSSPVQQIQDEVTCSICLEPFKDPVILDCGHNFCQACITNYWKASGAGICPQCRQSLPEGELRPNKELKAVADRVKGLDGDCKKHGERFSLFCQEERTLICKVCRESWQHRAHRVLPIEAAAEEFKEQLVRHQNGFQHAREKRERRAAAEERKYQILLEQTEREKKEIVSEFKQVHQILTHGEKLTCNKLEGTKKDLVKARNKNTEGLLRLDNLIDEIRQKCQQQGIEVLQVRQVKNMSNTQWYLGS